MPERTALMRWVRRTREEARITITSYPYRAYQASSSQIVLILIINHAPSIMLSPLLSLKRVF
jgi:hypothetical protein